MEPGPLHWELGVFATGPTAKSPQPFYFTHSFKALGFPGESDGKEFACIAGAPGLIPGLGRCPGEGKGYPLQYFCLGNPMDRGAWRPVVHGIAKSQT